MIFLPVLSNQDKMSLFQLEKKISEMLMPTMLGLKYMFFIAVCITRLRYAYFILNSCMILLWYT